MTEKRAYRINSPFFGPDGTRFARSGYFETGDAKKIALLDKAKAGTVEKVPLRVAGVTLPEPAAAETEPTGDEGEGEDDQDEGEDEVTEQEPDWEYMTIPNLRVWIDRAGVKLPGKRNTKLTHETLCREAWAGGVRPHPLWALPGGPEASAGIAAPPVSEAALLTAVEQCGVLGVVVPEATRLALAAYSPEGTPEPTEPAAAEPAEEGAPAEDSTQAASEPAGAPEEEEAAAVAPANEEAEQGAPSAD